jgi:hypothetical protein
MAPSQCTPLLARPIRDINEWLSSPPSAGYSLEELEETPMIDPSVFSVPNLSIPLRKIHTKTTFRWPLKWLKFSSKTES